MPNNEFKEFFFTAKYSKFRYFAVSLFDGILRYIYFFIKLINLFSAQPISNFTAKKEIFKTFDSKQQYIDEGDEFGLEKLECEIIDKK